MHKTSYSEDKSPHWAEVRYSKQRGSAAAHFFMPWLYTGQLYISATCIALVTHLQVQMTRSPYRCLSR